MPSAVEFTVNNPLEIPGGAGLLNITLPEGFSFSGPAKVSLSGASAEVQPPSRGGDMMIDLGPVLQMSAGAGHIVINEILPYPMASEAEKIELYNAASSAVNVTGWYIKDLARNTVSSIPGDILLGGTTIPPGGFLILSAKYLNDGVDSIWLYNITNDIIDNASYPSASSHRGMSYSRKDDGGADWDWMQPTLGSSNNPSSDSLEVHLNITADCGARSGVITAHLSHAAGSSEASSNVSVSGADLVMELTQDLDEALIGDTALWTLFIRNAGPGTAANVSITAYPQEGLLPEASSLSWQLQRLQPDENATITFRTRVTSDEDLGCTARASWGCAVPCASVEARGKIHPSDDIYNSLALRVEAPDLIEVGVSFPCSVVLSSASLAAKDIRLTVALPPEVVYAGGSEANFGDVASPSEPQMIASDLVWDLSDVIARSRHPVINEFDQNPPGPDGGAEWVEIYNPTPEEVEIGGWQMTAVRADSGNEEIMIIPADTLIPPRSYLVVIWTAGSLVNSEVNKIYITLKDGAGREIDRTIPGADEKNDDRSWARHPDGSDPGYDPDWLFGPPTRGRDNGGDWGDMNPGEAVSIHFNLTPGCGAANGSIGAGLTAAGISLRSSKILDIRDADVHLDVLPDIYDAAVGDIISWNATLYNTGRGTARNVSLQAHFNDGLETTDSPSGPSGAPPGLNWQIPDISPGGSATLVIRTLAVSPVDFRGRFEASWDCGNTSDESFVDARTAIRKLPDAPRRFSIGDRVEYEIYAALPDGGAGDLWINDTVPRGMALDESSISISGAQTKDQRIVSQKDNAGPVSINLSFGDLSGFMGIVIRYSARVVNSADNQEGTAFERQEATMIWRNESGIRVADSDAPGEVTVAEPALGLSMTPSKDHVSSGGNITYTIYLCHNEESDVTAYDVVVNGTAPDGFEYLPGSAEILTGPVGSSEDGPIWRFDEIDPSWKGSKKVLLRYTVRADVVDPGESPVAATIAAWSSLAGALPGERDGSGGLNDYTAKGESYLNGTGITLDVVGSPDPVAVGGSLTYDVHCTNPSAVPLHNLTIKAEIDPSLRPESSTPPLSGDGWVVPVFSPGGSFEARMTVGVPLSLRNGTVLSSGFSAISDDAGPVEIDVRTTAFNGTRLSVQKTASATAIRRGETLDYTIKVCNAGDRIERNVRVTDVFALPVEILSTSPSIDGTTWNIESLRPGECALFTLTVRVPRPDVKFSSEGVVSGVGFLRRSCDYRTDTEPYTLVNRVYVTADGLDPLSDESRVAIIGEPGTSIRVREHGSGDYSSEETLHYISRNKSLELLKNASASLSPLEFVLPGNRSLPIRSFWAEAVEGRNGLTGAFAWGSVEGASRLASARRLHLDENSSEVYLDSEFEGRASIGYSRPGVFTSSEDYSGVFDLDESLDDCGSSVASDRRAQGLGQVDLRRQVGSAQGLYEGGSGRYESEDRIRTVSSYISREINASSVPSGSPFTRSGGGWRAGVWSRGPSGYASEEYSGAGRLQSSTQVLGPSEMRNDASFVGVHRFSAIEEGNAGVDEVYMGIYTVERHVAIAGGYRYDRPHLSLVKTGMAVPNSTLVMYEINLKNDGNAALAPVFVMDLLPPGARFVNSTLRPSEVGEESINWTLVHLPSGGSASIGLVVNATCAGDLVNVVEAGGESGGWISARNFSIIQSGGMECAPLDVVINKTSFEDPERPGVVTFRLSLENRADGAVAARVYDDLQSEFALLGATMEPEVCRGRLIWTFTRIEPGKRLTWEYEARAPKGPWVSTTAIRAEVYLLDGRASNVIEDISRVASLNLAPMGDGSGAEPPLCACNSL